MKQDNTLRTMSAMVLILSTMSGCSSDFYAAVFGETRTLPEGAKVDFNNRHSPVLNPSPGSNVIIPDSALDRNPVADPSENTAPGIGATVPYTPGPSSAVMPAPMQASSGRRVPVENMVSQNATAPATMSAPVSAISASPLAAAGSMPSSPATGLATGSASVAAPSVTAAAVPLPSSAPPLSPSTAVPTSTVKDLSAEVAPMPVAPTMQPITPTMPAISVPATASSKSAPSGSDVPPPELKDMSEQAVAAPTASAPSATMPVVSHTSNTVASPTEAAPQKASGNSSASTADAGPAVAAAGPSSPASMPQSSGVSPSHPDLANVPATPDVPSKSENSSEFNGLVADHDSAESSRQQLMKDQSATVMTSPQTGQLVANPDTAAPAASSAAVAPAMAVSPQAPASAPAPVQQASGAQAASGQGGGFGTWLHHLFSGNPKPQSGNSAAASAGETTTAPTAGSMNVSTPSASAGVTAAPATNAASDTSAFQPRDISAQEAAVPPAAKNHSDVPAPMVVDLTAHPNADTQQQATQEAAAPSAPAAPSSGPSQAAIESALQATSLGKEVAPNVMLVSPEVDMVSQPIADSGAPASTQASAAPASGMPATVQPITAQPVDTSSQPAPARAAVEPVHLMPTPEAAADASAPAAPATSTASPAPVHLTPPPDGGSSNAAPALPDVSQGTGAQEAPIVLTPPPSQGSASGQTQYLNDSRYAGRAAQQDSGASN